MKYNAFILRIVYPEYDELNVAIILKCFKFLKKFKICPYTLRDEIWINQHQSSCMLLMYSHLIIFPAWGKIDDFWPDPSDNQQQEEYVPSKLVQE